MKLVVATTNQGKLREITDILQSAPVELVTLDKFPAIPEPEETGATFAENARLKAHAAAQASRATSLNTIFSASIQIHSRSADAFCSTHRATLSSRREFISSCRRHRFVYTELS